MIIGDKIKQARADKNLSIRKLGRLTDISSSHLSRIERNIQNPPPKILRKITRYIDLNYSNLMKELGLGLNIGLNNSYIYEYYSSLKGNDLRQVLNSFEKQIIERYKLLRYLQKCEEKEIEENDISDLLLDTIGDIEYLLEEEQEIFHMLERQALKEYRNKGEE